MAQTDWLPSQESRCWAWPAGPAWGGSPAELRALVHSKQLHWSCICSSERMLKHLLLELSWKVQIRWKTQSRTFQFTPHEGAQLWGSRRHKQLQTLVLVLGGTLTSQGCPGGKGREMNLLLKLAARNKGAEIILSMPAVQLWEGSPKALKIFMKLLFSPSNE